MKVGGFQTGAAGGEKSCWPEVVGEVGGKVLGRRQESIEIAFQPSKPKVGDVVADGVVVVGHEVNLCTKLAGDGGVVT